MKVFVVFRVHGGPEDNDFMYAEVVQTDDEFDRFEVTEREIQ